MLRIIGVKMPLNSTHDDLFQKILALLKVEKLDSFRISKKSIDARKKNDIFYSFNVDIEAENECELLKRSKNIIKIEKKEYSFPASKKQKHRPVIIGTGPAGLFAGLVLAQNGYRPILLERGADVKERELKVRQFWKNGILDMETNVQFGEGGAGTFSDGKLTTGIKDFRISKVLEEFVKHGAPEEILYSSKPHIGTDILKRVVSEIRHEITALGGEVLFNTRAEGIETKNGRVCGVCVRTENGEATVMEAEKLMLAIGHSARDTMTMLHNIGVSMTQKPFSVGVRIEHLQEMINNAQYGEFSGYLPPAAYKLSAHLENGRGVYTFCMCPGGLVVNAASETGGVVTNGMSNFSRNERNANSALLVSVAPADLGSDNPLAGIEFQRNIERQAFLQAGGDYSMPIQTVGSFLNSVENEKIKDVLPSVLPKYKFCDFKSIFPDFVISSLREALEIFDKKIRGFSAHDSILTAPETRSSSPVRIQRDEKHSTNILGLYSAGEGGGHAGGIISSAVDGIKTAEFMVKE